MTFHKLLNKHLKLSKKYNVEPEGVKLLILELSGLNGADFLASFNDEVNDEVLEKIEAGLETYYWL